MSKLHLDNKIKDLKNQALYRVLKGYLSMGNLTIN
jgi:hypothetical protein